jgi:methylated-DNA-protein-cysteine methyltransferase-like protein
MFNQILQTIRRVPRGQVATYGEIARAAGFPGAARQVVWALQGSASKGVPWHRILGAGGRILLRGHAGFEQRMRLEAEGVQFRGDRVDMRLHEFKARGAGRASKRKTGAKKAEQAVSKRKSRRG